MNKRIRRKKEKQARKRTQIALAEARADFVRTITSPEWKKKWCVGRGDDGNRTVWRE